MRKTNKKERQKLRQKILQVRGAMTQIAKNEGVTISFVSSVLLGEKNSESVVDAAIAYLESKQKIEMKRSKKLSKL